MIYRSMGEDVSSHSFFFLSMAFETWKYSWSPLSILSVVPAKPFQEVLLFIVDVDGCKEEDEDNHPDSQE